MGDAEKIPNSVTFDTALLVHFRMAWEATGGKEEQATRHPWDFLRDHAEDQQWETCQAWRTLWGRDTESRALSLGRRGEMAEIVGKRHVQISSRLSIFSFLCLV